MKDEPSFRAHSWSPNRGRVESRDPEEVAIVLFGLIASSPERVGRFLAVTGVAAEDLRGYAHEPSFTSAVLDYVASDEALLLDLAGESGFGPAAIGAACAASRRVDEVD